MSNSISYNECFTKWFPFIVESSLAIHFRVVSTVVEETTEGSEYLQITKKIEHLAINCGWVQLAAHRYKHQIQLLFFPSQWKQSSLS